MTPSQYFTAPSVFANRWDDWFIFALILAMAVLGLAFFREREHHEPGVHSPRLAWMRAGLYFCFAFVLSWLTGVLQVIVHCPPVTTRELHDPLWIALTGVCLLAAVWGYLFWWPRGTLIHGRRLYLLPTLVYGVLWGLSSGQIYLSVYAIVEKFGFPRVVTAILVYFLLSSYSVNYQLGWWDIYVSPPHNIRAWNGKKVLFAHTPFLISTLAYFTLYGNAAIYVALQVFALTACAMAMRFPPFWLADGEPVSRETALGV